MYKMHEDMTFNAWKGLTKIKRIRSRNKRVKAQPEEPFLIQTD